MMKRRAMRVTGARTRGLYRTRGARFTWHDGAAVRTNVHGRQDIDHDIDIDGGRITMHAVHTIARARRRAWRTKATATTLALGLSLLAACSDDSTGPSAVVNDRFTFDANMEGWAAKATDIVVGEEEIAWSVERSDEQKDQGTHSLEFYQDNLTDAAKVWIEKAYTLEPDTEYEVRIDYRLGTKDFGNANLFKNVAGARASAPQTGADIQAIARDETGNGATSDVGYRWLSKSYTSTVETDAAGKLYVVVGIWGTWETERSHYVDDLRVRIVEK